MSERVLESYTVVLLRRPPDAPELPEEELDRVQSGHLEHMDGLRERGLMLAYGPFRDQADETLRGFCVMSTSIEEARELMASDPSVVAGRIVLDVFSWLIPPGLARFGA